MSGHPMCERGWEGLVPNPFVWDGSYAGSFCRQVRHAIDQAAFWARGVTVIFSLCGHFPMHAHMPAGRMDISVPPFVPVPFCEQKTSANEKASSSFMRVIFETAPQRGCWISEEGSEVPLAL